VAALRGRRNPRPGPFSQSAACFHPRRRPQPGKHRKALQAGIDRRVAPTLPHFLSLIDILPQTDLIATVPTRAAESLARNAALRIQPLRVKPPTLAVKQFWHWRFHRNRPARTVFASRVE